MKGGKFRAEGVSKMFNVLNCGGDDIRSCLYQGVAELGPQKRMHFTLWAAYLWGKKCENYFYRNNFPFDEWNRKIGEEVI